MIARVDKKINSPADLDRLRDELAERQSVETKSVRVCIGTGCAAKGSRRLYEVFCEAAKQAESDVQIETKCVGCHGFCERGPIVVIQPGNILYQSVEEADIGEAGLR